jgi:hypothetical protein
MDVLVFNRRRPSSLSLSLNVSNSLKARRALSLYKPRPYSRRTPCSLSLDSANLNIVSLYHSSPDRWRSYTSCTNDFSCLGTHTSHTGRPPTRSFDSLYVACAQNQRSSISAAHFLSEECWCPVDLALTLTYADVDILVLADTSSAALPFVMVPLLVVDTASSCAVGHGAVCVGSWLV